MKWYGAVWRGMMRTNLGGIPSERRKKVVDFLVHALKVLFSVGVPGVLQSMMEGVRTGSGDGRKIGFKLNHGCDFNTSGKKAVSLEILVGLAGLKSFIRL